MCGKSYTVFDRTTSSTFILSALDAGGVDGCSVEYNGTAKENTEFCFGTAIFSHKLYLVHSDSGIKKLNHTLRLIFLRDDPESVLRLMDHNP